ncbi:MAG: 4Fe-4S ferredoxin [Herbinix sp.]|jgi:ferredoxin|nr:4Fe-4S ferredoxin [Herbinix sp.]
MKTTIYYFTGTGNSLKVAKELAALIPDCDLIRIHKKNLSQLQLAPEGRVGFVFPVYYYGIPKLMQHFMKELMMKPDTYVFTIITCGGSAGPAMGQTKRLIHSKGLKLSASYSVIMPDNYIVFFDPASIDNTEQLLGQQESITKEIANTIVNNGVQRFVEKSEILATVFGPVAARTFHPNKTDRNFWLEDTCNGCGTCAKLCPADNITIQGSRPIWLHQCEQCFACIHSCPKRSIQYKKGTLKKGRYRNPAIKLSELYISKH